MSVNSLTYVRPESVVSNPKSARFPASSPILSNSNLPARKFCVSGANGDSPAAIKSAFRNTLHFTKSGKNSEANVVLPAPLGPATT